MSKRDNSYLLLSTEEKLKANALEDPIIDLVDSILYKALDVHASDIHFQPDADVLTVRYRIDGILYDQAPIKQVLVSQVLSRIKVLSSLDIAQKRLPQDGKFNVCVNYDNRESHEPIDFRVSTFPSIYGEKMVVRILDRAHNLLELESLGMHSQTYESINRLVKMPYGFFLVTGPTGSGKTTSLYAILSGLNSREKNIVTMEDPVEYDLRDITQSQVNIKTGFTFKNGLRSMLRQDPDIIMIGEIRDRETAQIAIEAALTGHLVLSTLHTNDAPGAITRLCDMGVEPFLINASVAGVLAQRLARRLCSACKQKEALNTQEKDFLKRFGYNTITHTFKAKGCSECFNLGYKGRIGIFELLVISDTIRELIMRKAPAHAIREQAIQENMQTLFYDGIFKVQQGVVSFEELFSLLQYQ